MTLEQTITLAALENAIKFKGTANPKALTGVIIREHPECKSDMPTLMKTIASIVADINNLSLEEQEAKLLGLNPEFKEQQEQLKQERKKKANELPDLPNAVQGKVVTRIPPEPSKYAHLGHAMSFLINYLYAKKYEGKAILRFDDTNPEKESQEYVDAIKEDILNYLGIEVSETLFASDHMHTYLEYAQQLIDKEQAYTCNCTNFSDLRREQQDCPCRNQDQEQTQQTWNEMKQGTKKEFVLRLKISMQHKNAVMRDPVIFRVVDAPHYKQGTTYHVWPMYDFETAIEEGLTKVTHVLRSNEFDQRIELHNYIGSLFGFDEVTYKHYGRYNVVGATTQGREIRALIESGKYIGWDDPRLVTLKALKRRGILKEAFYVLAQQIGLSKTQTNLDFGVIAAVNRNLLDEQAKRYFAITEPTIITVQNIPEKEFFELAYHPHGKKGERKLSVTTDYYVEQKDVRNISVGQTLRLIDSMNIKKIDDTTYEFVSFEQDKSLDATLIHYVPKDGKELQAELFLPDTTTQQVILESNAKQIEVNNVVQFERTCFARLDAKESDLLRFWFTHE